MNTNEENVENTIEMFERYKIKEIDKEVIKFLRRRLAIGDSSISKLLETLELGGTISKPDKRGIRKVWVN